MPLTNAGAARILKLIFQNIAAAGIGDVAGVLGSTVAGNLYISLLTARPSATTADQTTNEVSLVDYPTYARLAVPRTNADWLFTAPRMISNINKLSFPVCAGGTSPVIPFYGIGTAASGAGKLLYMGAFSSRITVIPTKKPVIAAGDLRIYQA